jgi:hypothetical protein
MIRDPRAVLLNDELLSQVLRGIRPRMSPPGLTTSLRVLASRERQRLVSGAGRLDRLRLCFDNLMRPLALPFAGGVFAAIVLFGMCMLPNYPVLGRNAIDVPTMLTTQATVKLTGPVGAAGSDVIVDVTVDGQGRMVDFTIVSGGNVVDREALRRNIENLLLFTEFTPATSFGQPTSSRMRLSLRPSSIDVKG